MPINLESIKFKAGSSVSDKTPLEVQLGSILVFVGPNNSGKSLALREIENWCLGPKPKTKVISNVGIKYPDTYEEALQLLKNFETGPPTEGQAEVEKHFWIGVHAFRQDQPVLQLQISEETLQSSIDNKNEQYLIPHLINPYTVRLDGRTRFALSNDQNSGDIKKAAKNHLWALFRNDKARKTMRDLTNNAFELYFTVDPTNMTKFGIRLSRKEPEDNLEEQALDERARKFHSNATHISEFSDGVQAFVGLTSAILSLEHKIMLVDEPEAFLHPSLAYLLGENMAEIADVRNASLVVSTHSSEFLMACLTKVQNISVVRLTYRDGTATARDLSADELKDMIQDPLLRSTKTLEALFHNAVVITESDTDRAFYDEINRRLESDDRGIGQCLFLNAQNKQTISRILKPLREIGVPAVGIPDLDVLNMLDTNWNDLMLAIRIPSSEFTQIDKNRKNIVQEFASISTPEQDAIKKIGVSGLTATKTTAENLLKKLSEYGLFIVENGELETWLSNLNVNGKGAKWLVKMFSKLGSDINNLSYVKPASNDVWKFLDDISKWTNDPTRKGT